MLQGNYLASHGEFLLQLEYCSYENYWYVVDCSNWNWLWKNKRGYLSTYNYDLC